MIVQGLDAPAITTPATFFVYTPKPELTSGWTNAAGFTGTNAQQLVGTENGLNKFRVTVVAPPGVITIGFVAFSTETEDRLQLAKTVTAYTGPTYGQFSLKYTEHAAANRLNAAGRVLFLSIKPARWRLAIKLQRRSGSRWVTVAEQKSAGKDVGGKASFRVNQYGKSLRVSGKTWSAARSACVRGTVHRVVVSAVVSRTNGKKVWSKALTRRLRSSSCTASAVTPGGGRPRL